MTTSLVASCPGTITQSLDGAALCSTAWVAVPQPVPFELSQIDPAVAAQAFAAGFSICVIPWATAFAAAFLLKFLRNS